MFRMNTAQREQVLALQEAGLGPRGVQERRRMPFRQHETVVVGMLRIARVVAHLGKEQRRDDVGRRAARAGVAAARL